MLQIAHGDGWVPGAIVVLKSGFIDDNNTCAPESLKRLAAYDELSARFERYQAVDGRLVQILIEGANQPCNSFLDPKER